MNIEGTHHFDAPQELVWRMLLDPVVLAKVMPNCQALEKTGEGEYEGKIKIQVGPVQGLFQGKVTLSNLQAPTSYHMHVQGKGPAGVVDGEGDVRLESADGKTIMHYTGEAKVSGRIASIGQRLMDTSARAITKQSLENLEQQIVASQRAQSAPVQPDPEGLPAIETEIDRQVVEEVQENAASKIAFESPPPITAKTAHAPSQVPPSRVADTPASSTAQFAASIGRELFNEFVPADKQKWVLAAAALLLVHLYLNWWANLIARRIIRQLE